MTTRTTIAPTRVACASGAIAYTFTNVAYKTFVFPSIMSNQRPIRCSQKWRSRKETENGIEIVAETKELKIDIDLDSITPKTTKMSVDSVKSIVLKDVSMATAIIEQTGAILATE